MTAVQLGWEPLPLVVMLRRRSDFIQTLRTADASDWPAGTEIAVVFNDADGTSWPAALDGDTATWNVDKTLVAALIERGPLYAVVTYSDGAGADLEWMEGRVVTSG